MMFHDAAGNLINYGNRWNTAPPDDSYSVEEHTERFRPLHRIAEALITHLAESYQVTVETGPHVVDILAEPPSADEIAQAMLLTPNRNGAAPLLVVFTEYPGIRLYAGAFFHGVYPSCGCDACDDIWQNAADELERDVFVVITGGLSERVNGPVKPTVSKGPDGRLTIDMGLSLSASRSSADGVFHSSSETNAINLPPELLTQYRATLDRLTKVSPDGNWLPWPRVVQPD